VLFCEAVPVGTVICEIKPEERYTKRLEQAKPVLDALLAWANDLIPRTAPKSALGKALHYLKEQSVAFEYHRYGSFTEVPVI
jgi:hypothetical protein